MNEHSVPAKSAKVHAVAKRAPREALETAPVSGWDPRLAFNQAVK
jgi:hypothetical protein